MRGDEGEVGGRERDGCTLSGQSAVTIVTWLKEQNYN